MATEQGWDFNCPQYVDFSMGDSLAADDKADAWFGRCLEKFYEQTCIGIASQSDVKSAARESVNIKWQRRWEVSEKGRHLFTHRPGVKLNKVEFNSHITHISSTPVQAKTASVGAFL